MLGFARLVSIFIFRVYIGFEVLTNDFKSSRHSGRDCRNPDATDGKLAISDTKKSNYLFPDVTVIAHVPVNWIPAIPAGMTGIKVEKDHKNI
jgi:hypothetical protein